MSPLAGLTMPDWAVWALVGAAALWVGTLAVWASCVALAAVLPRKWEVWSFTPDGAPARREEAFRTQKCAVRWRDANAGDFRRFLDADLVVLHRDTAADLRKGVES